MQKGESFVFDVRLKWDSPKGSNKLLCILKVVLQGYQIVDAVDDAQLLFTTNYDPNYLA